MASTVPAPDPDAPTPSSLRELTQLSRLPFVARERYEVAGEFARGGIGRILEATDLNLDRTVAIKELRRGGSRYARLRFTREIRITARLQHPNIIAIHEAGRWPEGEPFFTMKRVAGGSLEEAIERADRPRACRDLLPHVIDVADAMAYAHSRGIVHRDLKPSNILVGPFGETMVIDWGLAKDQSGPEEHELPPPSPLSPETVTYQTTDGAVMGTPPYMPPEQAAGKPVDERADVYALGAILYHVLSGRVPYFEVPPRAVLRRVRHGPPTPLEVLEPHTPPDLLAIVDKAMARDPRHRYADAADMATELHRFADGRLVEAYRYSLVELVQRFVRRYRAAVTVAGVSALVLFCFGAWSVRRIADQRDDAEAARDTALAAAAREAEAHATADRRKAEAMLAGAEAALAHDPTLSLRLLAELENPLPGAATVAADAAERGVATRVLTGPRDRVDAVHLGPTGEVWATSSDGRVWRWGPDADEGRATPAHRGRVPDLRAGPTGRPLTIGYDGRLLAWAPDGTATTLAAAPTSWRAIAIGKDRIALVGLDGLRLFAPASDGLQELRVDPSRVDRPAFVALSPDGRETVTGDHGGGQARWYRDDAPTVVLEHPAPVTAAVFDDRGHLVTGCEDGMLRYYEGGAARPIRRIEAHRGPITALVAVSEGRVVSGGFDGAVRAWSPGRRDGRTLVEHDERVLELARSPDGQVVASGSWDRSVGVYDLRRGYRWRFRGHRDAIHALAFSRDGATLASGSWDREVRLWSLSAGGSRLRREAHRFGVKSVDYSPDGTLVASGGHDDMVRLWSGDGRPLRAYSGHSDHVYRVRFSPDGRWIASSSDDRTVRLWPVGEGAPVTHRGHRADVEELAFSADGRTLASAGEDHRVGLWPVGPGEGRWLEGHTDAVTDLAFVGSEQLMTASLDGTVRRWDAREASATSVWTVGHPVRAVAFAARFDTVAAATPTGVMLQTPSADAPTKLTGVDAAEAVAFSDDGIHLAVGSSSGTVWLCLWARDACRRLEGHGSKIHRLVFTADAATLLSASGDGTVRVWDAARAESRPYRMHTASVFDIALAPDGRRVVSASGDMTLSWWTPDGPPPSPPTP
ncbi:MAG: protein kinase [Myxococcota bacterium]